MSSEEVFKVTSFQPPAVKSSSTLCAIRYNFLPDSVDKSSGTLSVSQSGEVNLSYSGNRNCKATRFMMDFSILSYSHSAKIKMDLLSGHPDSKKFPVLRCSGLNGNPTKKAGGNDHFYSGNQSVAKDYEYVLIVDRKNKTARIEKINHSISLRNVRRSRRLSSGNDRSGSPVNGISAQKRTCTNSTVASDDEIESLNSEIFKDFI